MKTRVIILIEQSFFKTSGVEYACAVDARNIRAYATYDEAIEEIRARQEIAKKCGYRIAVSGTEDEDPDICYWLRMENSGGRGMVFKVKCSFVEGDWAIF